MPGPYAEDDLLPLSALQHLLFCERQCALIHTEQLWADNALTAEGNELHAKAHSGKPETRDGMRITRSLPLRSFIHGLTGQADVIEWEIPDAVNRIRGALAKCILLASPAERQRWRVIPVEYKRGKPKANDCDRVQLCAQAICLEEMLEIEIPSGDLYYGQNRRRTPVLFDAALRQTVATAARRLHELISSRVTPPAVREKKCDSCSLISLCMPDTAGNQRSALHYLHRMTDS